MKPICSRRVMVSVGSLIRLSSMVPMSTRRVDGLSSPAAHWIKVLLPEPDGPMMAVKLPSGNCSLISRSAATVCRPLPKVLLNPCNSTAGVGKVGGSLCGVAMERSVPRTLRILMRAAVLCTTWNRQFLVVVWSGFNDG